MIMKRKGRKFAGREFTIEREHAQVPIGEIYEHIELTFEILPSTFLCNVDHRVCENKSEAMSTVPFHTFDTTASNTTYSNSEPSGPLNQCIGKGQIFKFRFASIKENCRRVIRSSPGVIIVTKFQPVVRHYVALEFQIGSSFENDVVSMPFMP